MLGQRLLKSGKGEKKVKQRVGEPQENKVNVRDDVGRNKRHGGNKRFVGVSLMLQRAA